jgi:hypothetical protein
MRVALSIALVLAIGAGCKSKTKADLSNPETTLESFFKSLNAGEMPGRLSTFITSEEELAMWRMRCKTRGCKKAKYSVRSVAEKGENGATLIVDYIVVGKNDLQVMKGNQSEIRFERAGSSWGIVQFGRRLGKKPPVPAAAIDAAPPMPDAGPAVMDASSAH